MKKDFSKFKVLGITLLMTMSSCVGGSVELNAETLRSYGFEFEVSSFDRTQLVLKQKKAKASNPKFKFNNIIESGRCNVAVPGFFVDYTPIVFYLRFRHFENPLTNKHIEIGEIDFSKAFHGINFQNRAGPSSC